MIRIGVAGWDYPDWAGIVYPMRPQAHFDRLAHLARYVDTIEINSTFYRPVRPPTADSWLRRIEPYDSFVFTAKAHRSWTHGQDEIDGPAFWEALAGLDVLLAAGKLGALLLQFPQSFHDGELARARLAGLLERLASWPAVVEVRHASWESDEAQGWIERLGAGWCAVDQPLIGGSTARRTERVVGPVGYLRMHGRNSRNWFRAGAGRDARYDYLYTDEQLDDLARAARKMASAAQAVYVIQNNHFRGQAVVNALQMRYRIEQRPPAAPAALVAHYPALAAQVRVEDGLLF